VEYPGGEIDVKGTGFFRKIKETPCGEPKQGANAKIVEYMREYNFRLTRLDALLLLEV